MDQQTAVKLLTKAAHLVQAGKPRDARKPLDRVLKAFPGQPDALHTGGLIHLAEGRLERAEALIRQAIAQRPREPGFHANLAVVLTRAGRWADAVEAARAALALAPTHAPSLELLGRALLALGRPEEAIAPLERLAGQRPRQPGPLLRLADARRMAGQGTVAAEAYRAVLAVAPETVPALIGLASIGPPAVFAPEALATLKTAATLAPEDPTVLGLLAIHLEQANRLDEAAQAADRALVLAPGQISASLAASRLAMRTGDLQRAEATLEEAMAHAADTPPDLAAQAAWVTAQIADRQGDTTRAAEAMRRAHDLHRQTPAVQATSRRVLPERIAFFRDALADRPEATPRAVDPAQPIFFVGYPRSGTTLMEQILAAHPGLVTTAEQPFLARVMMDLPTVLGRPFRYPQDLSSLTDEEAARAAAHYRRVAEDGLGSLDGRRIVDKLPLNLVELPFVERLFPGAAVLVALRDPRDVVLSNVMQLFAPNAASIHSDSIDGCATAYAQVMGLWEVYRTRLALPHLVYRYEDLVDDFYGTVRRIVDFLALPWDAAVTDYTTQARDRHIQTPSYARVLQRPDRRAIGRWRRYESWLAPALPTLAPHLTRYGYTDGP